MTHPWWHQYGPFSASAELQGYPEPREVFVYYVQRSGMSRAQLAGVLGLHEKMVYRMEKYGDTLHSMVRLRQLCVLLRIPSVLFGLAERPDDSSSWPWDAHEWPRDADGFPAPGAVIRHFRQVKGWRQHDLAQALDLSEVTIRLMEKHHHNLDSLTRRQALAFVLGVPAAARILLGLDSSHVSLPGTPVMHATPTLHLSLEAIHRTQEQLWATYYAGAPRPGMTQARSLIEQIGEVLPLVGEAERPQWLASQSLLLQWLINATRETGDPKVVLARAKKALDLAKLTDIPDLVVTARMRQMETAYVLQREENALASAHGLLTIAAPDPVVDATRAVACARVLACAARDQEDRSIVLHLLDHAHHFGGTTYGLHYDTATYALRSAETLINLARNAPDRTPLLRQAEGLLATIKEPLSKLRLVGVRTAQAQVAVGLGEYEPAAMYANDAVNVAHEITMTTPLPAILEVYQELRHTSAANEPLTARLGLVLWQYQHL